MHLYATSILKSFLDGINQCRHLGASNPLPTSIESISIYESAILQFSRNYISRIVVSFEKVDTVLDRLCQGASLSIQLVKDQAVFKLYNVCKSNLANFPGITSLELLYHLKKWIRFWIGCINDCPRAYTTPLVKDLAVFTMYNVRICNLLEIYIYTIWIPAYSKIAWKCMLRDAHWYNLSKTGFTL